MPIPAMDLITASGLRRTKYMEVYEMSKFGIWCFGAFVGLCAGFLTGWVGLALLINKKVRR